MKNYLFTGVGGQGILLLSKLLSTLLMDKGDLIKTTETIGMSQMGGSVVSHLRASKSKIYSPFVPEKSADIVFGFEPGEVIRNLKYVGEETTFIIHDKGIKPISDSLSDKDYEPEKIIAYLKEKYKKVYVCNFDSLFEEIKSDKPMNIALLGTAISLKELDIKKTEAIRVLRDELPEKIVEINLKAFEYGFEIGKNLKR